MTQANKVSVTGIACINIPVTNVTVSKDWYVKNFGCQVLRDMERGNEWANVDVIGDVSPHKFGDRFQVSDPDGHRGTIIKS